MSKIVKLHKCIYYMDLAPKWKKIIKIERCISFKSCMIEYRSEIIMLI